jgi:hypothetical protein
VFRDDGTISGDVRDAGLAGGEQLACLNAETSVAQQVAPRRLEVRRSVGMSRSSSWTITPMRRQETVAYDIEASYRRRPKRALPPQVPASPLDRYPGEEPEWFGPEGMGPQWFDDESPRLAHARAISVRVRADREPGLPVGRGKGTGIEDDDETEVVA